MKANLGSEKPYIREKPYVEAGNMTRRESHTSIDGKNC